jgi:hypothetical protein
MLRRKKGNEVARKERERKENAHPSPRRTSQATSHPEAILPLLFLDARVFQSPNLDILPSQSPATKHQSLHPQRRVQSTDDGVGRVGGEKGEDETVGVEAEVAV